MEGLMGYHQSNIPQRSMKIKLLHNYLHMKNYFLFFVTLLVTYNAYSYPIRVSATYFGGNGTDELLDVAYAPDGTLVVAGSTDSYTWTLPSEVSTYVFGTDGIVASTIFVARFSGDGKKLLSFSRFAYSTVKSKDVRLAVSDSGIYIVAVGYSNLYNVPGFDVKIDNINAYKPFVARIALDGSKLLNGTFLGGGDSDRDVNDIDLFPNGDICVSHDNSGSSTDFLSRIKPDLSAYVWHRTFYVWCGSARTNAMAVTSDGTMVYVGGYGMGYTGLEPFKDPYLFCFSGDGITQYWKRSDLDNDWGVFNSKQDSIGTNRLISDSQINGLATDLDGNALCLGYSDGGATPFTRDPWFGSYRTVEGAPLASSIQDGDSFSGFAGATSASTTGRMGKDGYWIRSHTFKPYNIYNRMYGTCISPNNSMYIVGRSGGIPDVDNWEVGASNGVLMKLEMNTSGGNRRFVTHPAGVDALNKIARDRTTYRYAVVGKATGTNVYAVNGVQTVFGGGTADGYLLVFDDNDKPKVSEGLVAEADAAIIYGTNVNKNFGKIVDMTCKRRDSRTYETCKVYFRFDLSTITTPIAAVKFLLAKQGKYDNGDLTLYALKEGEETWDEVSITWNNAPANIVNSPSYLDLTKADSLGTWKIIKTNGGSIETYQGKSFSEYIENCRKNGDKKVTLVIATYNPTDQNDPTIKSASRENNIAAIKPTLELEFPRNTSVLTELLFYPKISQLLQGETRKISAIGVDQYGVVMTANIVWNIDNNGVITQDGIFQANIPGTYTLTCTSGTVTSSMTFSVATPVSIKSEISDNIEVFTDENYLSIDCKTNNGFVYELMNTMGQVFYKESVTTNKSTRYFNFASGIYLLKVNIGNKIVVKKVYFH